MHSTSLFIYLFLILFFLNFNWRLITLQYCGGFCHTLTNEPAMGEHVSPCPEPTTHLPSHPISLGCFSASALSALLHSSNLDWSSISHMVIYTFRRYPLKSSHPSLLSQSPKDCSLYLCLFCCLTYRIVVCIFLNVNVLYWCFSF